MRKEVVVFAAVAVAATMALVVVTLATKSKRKKEREWKKTQQILRKFARECATPIPTLWDVANSLVAEMQTSLSCPEKSTVDMLVSYINSLPNGDEKGLYYGVNLRATSFLILCARLGGKNEPISDLRREEISIPTNLLLAASQELFDYVAVELVKFVSEHPPNDDDLKDGERKLGFTVSYPVDQAASTSGSAIKWKRFSADDAVGFSYNDSVGKAFVNGINLTLKKHGLNMRVFALVDNTTGNLAGGRYYNKDAVAAVTLAMSSNAAYVENSDAVPVKPSAFPIAEEKVISVEWGNFNCSSLPLTEFDAILDAESSNPGIHIFEKLISAMYMGEIVRRVLLKMAQETSLFGAYVPSKLAIPYILSSPDMAAMHQDISEDHEVVRGKLKDIFEIFDSTPMVREVVAEVCDIVAERGARLAGAAVVGMLKKLGRIENRKNVVTVEGGLYEHYRVYRNYLHSSVWEMLGNDVSDNVSIEHSHGGSGSGALFLAACQNTKS